MSVGILLSVLTIYRTVTFRNGNFLLEFLHNFYGKFLSVYCTLQLQYSHKLQRLQGYMQGRLYISPAIIGCH